MSIQIYDKADKIEKEGKIYYFVKDGSKNCFSYGSRIGKDWFQEYPTREVRESDWKLVAVKTAGSWGKMADTKWNCPTSYIYGRIMFGNKYNIALYLDKKKAIKFEDLQEQQQYNVQLIINRYNEENRKGRVIDLLDVKPEQAYKLSHEYCGTHVELHEDKIVQGDFSTMYNDCRYWKLNNL